VLYFLDAYHGLFCVDLATHEIVHLVTPKSVIDECSSGSSDPVSTLAPKFYNDLDISNVGIVYFTDSSYLHSRSHNREELLDGAPRGRLLEYDLRTRKLRTLVCGLHFPNGVQIYSQASYSPDSDDQTEADISADATSTKLLVAELTRFRVLLIDTGASEFSAAYDGKAREADERVFSLLRNCGESGSLDKAVHFPQVPARPAIKIFLDSAPGCLDNIREDIYFASKQPAESPQKRFIIGVGTTSVKPFPLLWHAFQYYFLRDLVGRFVSMQWVEKLVPKYGLALVLDEEGAIVTAWHDKTGRAVHLISEADRHPRTGDVWLGSHSVHHISIVKRADVDV
jgi:hypothetical protein